MNTIKVYDARGKRKRAQKKPLLGAKAFLAMAALACGIGWYAGAKLAYEQKAVEISKVHYVEEGETLWDIATGISGDDQDIRKVIYDIAKLNDIAPDADLKVGKKIVIAK